MTSKPPSHKRPLSAEEAELWAHAMRDAKTLRRKYAADHRTLLAGSSEADASQADPPKPSQNTRDRESTNTDPRVRPDVSKSPPRTPPVARFDERQRRKLARNAERIDARLDLHGMRQRQAHTALRSFLMASAARGCRNVLIITGKGTRRETERNRDFFLEERGVLRRLVPQWLSEPEFRSIVLSFTTAAARHGGEGALYVRLRRLREHAK